MFLPKGHGLAPCVRAWQARAHASLLLFPLYVPPLRTFVGFHNSSHDPARCVPRSSYPGTPSSTFAFLRHMGMSRRLRRFHSSSHSRCPSTGHSHAYLGGAGFPDPGAGFVWRSVEPASAAPVGSLSHRLTGGAALDGKRHRSAHGGSDRSEQSESLSHPQPLVGRPDQCPSHSTTGSGAAAFVHGTGKEITAPSRSAQYTRYSPQLCRTVSSSNSSPNRGWNGWAMHTTFCEPRASSVVDC